MEPGNFPPPPVLPPRVAPATASASGKAITILVLGIVGLLCCNLTAPVAWALGHQTLRDIRLGLAPPQDHSLVQIGMVLGILGTVLLAFVFLWIFFFGGLAMLNVLLHR